MIICFLHLYPAGVSPSERGLVWRFLFGMYPCSSTALERSLLHEQLVIRYQVMKRKWQSFLPSAVRMHLNGTDGKRPEPCSGCIPSIGLIFLSRTNNPASFPAELVQAVRYFDQRRTQTLQRTQDQSEDVKDRLAFLQLQAQVSIEHVCKTVWSWGKLSRRISLCYLHKLLNASVYCIICTHCVLCVLKETVGWDEQNKSLLKLKLALLLWERRCPNDEVLSADQL